jgi:aryl-alcohol dehydrogenase-like predicted oxidoreductase
MKYRTLGQTGVQVSCLCMGTMLFGKETSEEASGKMFHRCREAGVNLFDTADAYNQGRSEEILGKLMGKDRGEIILASKVYFPTGADINASGLSRRHIMSAVEASLKRLQTDHLDLYFLHNYDPKTAIEEPLRALDDLVHQGKILYPAVSNWAAWQTAKGLGISIREVLSRFECIQPLYNLVKRQAEVELLPMAEAEKMGVMTYNPLGGGLLSGKYGVRNKPQHGRLIDNPMYVKRYGDPLNFEIAENFCAHAKERGVHPASLAIAWVMSHPAVTAPVMGARNLDQLNDLLGALDIQMTPEWRAEISSLSIEPPPVTDRSEEKRGIFYLGRKI